MVVVEVVDSFSFFFLSLDVCVCVILDFFLRFYDFAKCLSEFRMYEYSQCVCVCSMIINGDEQLLDV